MTITAETLTGEWVLAFRKRHKLSRAGLMQAGGFEGKSGARIMNIETKNAWKTGDRDRIMRVVRELEPDATDANPTNEHAVGDGRGAVAGHDDVWAEPANDVDDDDGDGGALGWFAVVDDAQPTNEPANADCADDACEPNQAAGMPTPVATPLRDDARPLVVPASGVTMPRGWEHLYPPTDDRHVHQFDENAASCANVRCGATPAGAPSLVSAEPDDVARLLAAVVPDGDVAPFGRPTLVLPDDGFKSLTASELKLWRRCRRAWMLAIYRALRPAQDSLTNARATGTRIHRALAAWYAPEGQLRVDPRDALERVIVEDWTKIYRAAVAAGMDDAWLATKAGEFAAVNSLERIMVEGYLQWLEDTGADAGYSVISSEQAVAAVVDVPGSDPVRLLGKLDVRLHRRSDGSRLFMDNKTAGSIQAALPTLRGNPQMLHYELLEWLTVDGGATVDGALYNMLKKVKRTVRATPPFYDRVEVRHNHHELEAYLKQTLAAAREIAAATAALDAGFDHQYVAPPTKTDDCNYCDFFAVCGLFDDGSRVEDALAGTYVTGDPLARYADDVVLTRADGTVLA